MGPIEGWGNVWGTSVTVPVTISTSSKYNCKTGTYHTLYHRIAVYPRTYIK